MKKIASSLLLVLVISAVSAQNFNMGVKGIFNSTWLFNSNIADRTEVADYIATFGYSSGLSSSFYFSESMGISIDLLYAWHFQILEGTGLYLPGDAYTSTTKVNYLDVPVLLRVSSEGGPYIEIGPQVSFLTGAEEEFEYGGSTGTLGTTTTNIKDDFNSINLAGVLGFGYDVEASDNVLINVGLRFGYGINDATRQFSETEFPNKVHGTISTFAHHSATDPNQYQYHKTARAFGGLGIGVIYKFH